MTTMSYRYEVVRDEGTVLGSYPELADALAYMRQCGPPPAWYVAEVADDLARPDGDGTWSLGSLGVMATLWLIDRAHPNNITTINERSR